ncbi:hypothetical protein ACFWBW_36340, partial [Streptomyces sp. NPDC059957]
MTLPGEEARAAGRGSASFGRDVVLAVGLAGICVGGLAVFLKTGAGGWVAPVVTAVVLAVGVALVKWNVSPVRRRSTAPPAPGPAAHGDPYPVEVTAVMDVPAAGRVPDVGAGALDLAAVDADGFEQAIAALC